MTLHHQTFETLRAIHEFVKERIALPDVTNTWMLMEEANDIIPRSLATLAVTSIAAFMIAIETSIISLALPQLREGFPDASESKLSWIVNAYTIGVASLLLVSGWLADRYGRKRCFLGIICLSRCILWCWTCPLSKFLNSRTNLASYRRCNAIPCRFSVTPGVSSIKTSNSYWDLGRNGWTS